ncbi:ABC transporter substrate-binding protein [Rhodococcus hoagii]|nr:ABC transporter substrate-binding protein [Prescottella equi]MBM4653979.1 ABC transporter substrate-binding protein [Prescottella equi]MBM4719755.1 ABC transporter substrate-binding protein [Prescottella equi]NKR23555.1 ABC transporter substrate-binding protein [Prescottella equi]NKT56291.1 ABC transporter substrate-binding protein [Prescottella equi]
MRVTSRSGLKLITVLTAGALALTGCANTANGDDTSGSGRTPPAAGFVGEHEATGDAVSTPQLTFSTQSLAGFLDPMKTAARGESGGSELAAVYDVLMRYDSATNQFEPRLAESLTEEPGGLAWTLKLRPGVTFSDGTPLDAAAVARSLDRYNAGRGDGSAVWTAAVESTTAADPSTVVFRLRSPWPTFPSMLALGHGMIVAPSSGEGDAFKPIGAGPYVLDHYSPNEERIFTARNDYWNGKPTAAKLRFIALTNSRQNFETLQTDGIDIAFLRGDASAVYDTIDNGYPGYFNILNSGSAELINNREGRPGADVRVRKAISLALDPDLIDERGEKGLGLPTKAMFDERSRWFTDVPALPYDPDAARQLLDEAKADGYDGHLNFLALQEPRTNAIALAVQSLLQTVGFTVTIVPINNAGDIVKKVYMERDYDMAHAGIGLYESIPYLGLQSAFGSTSKSNFSGYANPEMDALLGQLQNADDATYRSVLGQIQTLWNDTVPSVPTSALMIYVAWQKNVHGVVPTATNIMLLDKAWTG